MSTMSKLNRNEAHAIREAAYFIWEREWRPEGRSYDHWVSAIAHATFAILRPIGTTPFPWLARS